MIRPAPFRQIIGTAFAVLAVALITAAPARAVDDAFVRGLLWEVTPPGGGQPSHLFGTMHITDPRVVALADDIAPRVQQAAVLALEIDMSSGAQAEIAMGMIGGDGPGIDALVDADTYAALEAAVGEAGVPAFVLPQLRPWAVTVLVSLPQAELARIQTGAEPLDGLLNDLAATADVPVVGLETPAEQLAVLNAIDLDLQVDQLILALNDRAEVDRVFETLTQLYLDEDLAGFMVWLEDQMAGEDPELRAAFVDGLLTQRNRLMVERMEPLLEAGNAMVAVGAMHLAGDDGILAALDALGYGLQPVPLR